MQEDLGSERFNTISTQNGILDPAIGDGSSSKGNQAPSSCSARQHKGTTMLMLLDLVEKGLLGEKAIDSDTESPW